MRRLLMTLAAVLIVGAATAQNEQKQERKELNSTEMAQQLTNRMVQKYSLNDTQAKKLLELNKKYAGKMPGRPGGRGMRPDSIRQKVDGTTGASPKERPNDEQMQKNHEEMENNMKAYNSELKSIMGDEKYAQYEKDRKNARPHRKGQGPEPRQNN